MARLVWKILGLILAVAVSLPVTMLLLLLVTGFGDPGKQIYLPTPLLAPQFLLALLLPMVSAIVFGWWGLWRKAVGRVGIGALVGLSWILLVCLYLLDWNWGRVGVAPPGQVFLVNAANETVTYTTEPPVSDPFESSGFGPHRVIDPDQVTVLRNIPADGPLQITAVNAAGLRIFCGIYTPQTLARANGRVEISVGIDTCD